MASKLNAQLFEAVEAGDLDAVRRLLGEGASPDAHDEFDTSALAQAVDDERDDIVEVLLAAGAKPDPKGGDRPLIGAARMGLLAMTRRLLDAGADVHAADGAQGMNALQWTAWFARPHGATERRPGSLDVLRLLLERGARPDDAPSDGATALHVAASAGDAEVVSLLLDAGATPGRRNADGHTAAHVALHKGFVDVVDAIARRHDVMADEGGPGPVGWAARRGDVDALRRLLPQPKKVLDATWRNETPLLAAARLGRGDAAAVLAEAGANPDATDEDGESVLVHAARRGDVALVDALLRAGASLKVGKKDVSPLARAIWDDHPAVARRLVEAGLDVNAGKDAALPAAASRGWADLVRQLLAAGADLAKQGRAALLAAVDGGHVEVVRVLLDAGVDPDTKNEFRWPALVDAARRGHADVAAALLDKGASIDAKGDGLTPLQWAAQAGFAGLAKLLADRGAKARGRLIARIAAGDVDGARKAFKDVATADPWPALTWAALLGHEPLVEALLSAGADPAARAAAHPPHALGAAAMHGHAGIVERLLAAGALRDAGAGPEALHLAASRGQADAVRRLLARGVAVDVRNDRARTPLIEAAEEGQLEVLRVLLDAGADPTLQSRSGDTALGEATRRQHLEVVAALKAALAADREPAPSPAPATPAAAGAAPADVARARELVDAAEAGDLARVRALLAAGVPADARDERDRSPLAHALRKGQLATAQALVAAGAPVRETLALARMTAADVALVRWLLDAGADVNHAGALLPPLVMATRAGTVDVVRLLLARGADVNGQSARGGTALVSALVASKAELATLLLDAGADPSIGEGSVSPLPLAVAGGHAALARRMLLQLVKPAKKPQALVRAIAEGDAARVRTLLADGVPATAAEPSTKWPALHWACLFGEAEVVAALLDAGADAKLSKNGWTPVALAVAGGHLEIARALLARGADPNAAGGPNAPALLIAAAIGGHAEVADLLLASGAKPDASAQGTSALHFAAQAGHADVVRRLLARGARVEAKDRDGRTPLVLAVHYGHASVVEALVAGGAKVDVKWNDRALLHWAVLSGRTEAAQRLLAAHAKPDVADKDGATALHAAARRGDRELVEALLHAKARPNPATLAGRTPLMEAAWSGCADVVEILLARTDADWRDGNGASAADIAAEEGETDVLEHIARHHHPAGADLYLAIARGDVDAARGLLAGRRPSARMVLLAARAGQAAMVSALLALRPEGDLAPAASVAAAEGFADVGAALGQPLASEPRRLTEEMLELVKVPPPDTDVLLEGRFGRFRAADDRLATLVRAQIWMSDRHSMLPDVPQMDREMAGVGYEPLGALVCERIGDVVMRGYGAPDAAAYGAWAVGVTGTAVDFVSALADGSTVTTTTHEESKTSSSRGNYVRTIADASVRVLHHKHELRVRRRMATLASALVSSEPTLVALAQAVDRSLVLRFAES